MSVPSQSVGVYQNIKNKTQRPEGELPLGQGSFSGEKDGCAYLSMISTVKLYEHLVWILSVRFFN